MYPLCIVHVKRVLVFRYIYPLLERHLAMLESIIDKSIILA